LPLGDGAQREPSEPVQLVLDIRRVVALVTRQLRRRTVDGAPEQVGKARAAGISRRGLRGHSVQMQEERHVGPALRRRWNRTAAQARQASSRCYGATFSVVSRRKP
jgi:hypothetical protein